MNQTEKTILLSAGLVALSVLAGSWIIGHKVSSSLDNKNLWEGSGVNTVANDIHQVTGPLGQIGQAIGQWTRA